jgi:hypothetical protein
VARGDVAEVMFELADGLQEQFFPESFGAWGQARPACPGHTHPAEPTVIAAVACWVCPSTGEVLGPIGAYAP